MINLRRLTAAAALVLVAAAAALATAPTSAEAAIWSQRARAPQNAAGVVFHPYGDIFEIWDNVNDNKRARVYFRDRYHDWRMIPSKGHYTEVRRNMREKRNYVEFWIAGSTGSSPIVRFRTSGH